MELVTVNPACLVTTSTTNPTADDDSSGGFRTGALWINTMNREMFVCHSATVSTAMWLRIGLGRCVNEGTFTPTFGIEGRSETAPDAGDLYGTSLAVGRFSTIGSRATIDIHFVWNSPPANAADTSIMTIKNLPNAMVFSDNVGGSLSYVVGSSTRLIWGGNIGTSTVRLYDENMSSASKLNFGNSGELRLSCTFTFS